MTRLDGISAFIYPSKQSNMTSQTAKVSLPVELLYQVVDNTANPTDLLNLSCACSTLDAITRKVPLRLYLVDAQFHLDRSERMAASMNGKLIQPATGEERQASLPSLIHLVRTCNDMEHLVAVIKIFQKVFHKSAMAFPGFPTPLEAAIVAGRLDAVRVLHELGCHSVMEFAELRPQLAQIETSYRRLSIEADELRRSLSPPGTIIMPTRQIRDGRLRFYRPYVLALLHCQPAVALYLYNSQKAVFGFQYYFWWAAIQTKCKEVAIALLPDLRQNGRHVDVPSFQNDALNWAVSINSHELVDAVSDNCVGA
ncbi:hypothetical protein NUW58_g211 [Xylaria curta]|uniref:Uncharacterized protein n=1 Tax=Xylaria curta TaxID=42375 RepID=A0ACC1PR07_9PEZI|nr:hypothetical protein NUW58_g211 [Xylaria curta]